MINKILMMIHKRSNLLQSKINFRKSTKSKENIMDHMAVVKDI